MVLEYGDFSLKFFAFCVTHIRGLFGAKTEATAAQFNFERIFLAKTIVVAIVAHAVLR